MNISIPLNYKFNKTNVKKFLDECNKPFLNPKNKKIEALNTAEISKKIIDNTQHITFKKFISLLETNINDMIKLVEKGRPIFINIGNKKKSYWLFKFILNYIKNKYPKINIILLNSNIIDNKNLIDNDLVVYIDEAILDVKLGLYITKTMNITNNKLRFFILSSFITKSQINAIEKRFMPLANLGNKLIFNKTIIIPKNTRDILTITEMNLLSNIYKHLGDAIYKDLIYFDHNLGEPDKTFVAFYSGVVPNAENSYYLEKMYKNLDKLKIIPLLTNCETITTYKLNYNICPKTYE